MKPQLFFLPVLLTVATCFCGSLGADPVAEVLVKRIHTTGGYVSLPTASNSEMALALAEKTPLVIFAQVATDEQVLRARCDAASKGLLNSRVFFEKTVQNRIHLADHYADYVFLPDFSETTARQIPASEVLRVLSPHGKAIIGNPTGNVRAALEAWLKAGGVSTASFSAESSGTWVEFSKPMIAGSDDWSHWFHGPDNNNVSTDTAIKWPLMMQWTSLPYRGPQPSIAVVSDGVVYIATGNAYGSEKAVMSKYELRLTARNAFSGAVYWQRPIKPYQAVGRSAYVATPKTFYLLEDDSVLCLEPRTGREQRRIRFDGIKGEGKWMALEKGVLYLLAGALDRVQKPVEKPSVDTKYPLVPINEDYQVQWGMGQQLLAFDLESQKTLWVTEVGTRIDSRCIGLLDGRIFCYDLFKAVICVEGKTGRILWNNREEVVGQQWEEKAKKGFGHQALGGLRPGLLATPQAVLITEKGFENVAAFAPANGKLLWIKPLGFSQIFYEGGNLFRKQSGLVDLKTGETSKAKSSKGDSSQPFSYSIQGCGPINVTPNAYLGRHGLEYDRLRSLPIADSSFRAGCWQDAIPANGMMFVTPYTCGCAYMTRGFNVLISGAEENLNLKADPTSQLEVFSNREPEKIDWNDQDWYTHRANLRRSAFVPVAITSVGTSAWQLKSSQGASLVPPVCAGNLVFLASAAGRIQCVEAVSGQSKWELLTGGKIFAAPTIWENRLYAGSSDGYVYCAEAASGQLLWRFRAAPKERKLMLYDQFSSAWPVNSGVLVREGVAFFAAGFIDRDGTYVYALDAKTGALKWKNEDSGHINKNTYKGATAAGFLTIGGGRLWMSSGNNYSPMGYDLASGTAAVPDIVSTSAYSPVRRGKDIGFFGENYLIHGGPPLHSDQIEWFELSRGNEPTFARLSAKKTVEFPEILLNNSNHLPVWDDKELFVENTGAKEKGLFVEAWDAAKVMAFLEQEYPRGQEVAKQSKGKSFSFFSRGGRCGFDGLSREQPYQKWSQPNSGVFGLALGRNALVVVQGHKINRTAIEPDAWTLSVLNRADGAVLWKQELKEEPLFDGLCITRSGRIVLVYTNGNAECFGK